MTDSTTAPGATAPNQLQAELKVLYANLGAVILGKQESLFLLLVAVLARGHVLLEDVPGTGKTTLAKALARSLKGRFRRLQCTPDLMPSDVTGVAVYRMDQHVFEFVPGPVFTDILLADEINRATPRAQSCLLECMEERQVTVDGESRSLAETFFVIATQNPTGFHGTYPLPEAQLDRFLVRLRLGYPMLDAELQMLNDRMSEQPLDEVRPAMDLATLARLQSLAMKITIKPDVLKYIAEIVRATRKHDAVMLGASPRGSVALMRASQCTAMLSGRSFVTPDHIKRIAPAVLAHRITLKSATDSAAAEQVIAQILDQVPVPVATS
jgi:MoxR-like ATPase